MPVYRAVFYLLELAGRNVPRLRTREGVDVYSTDRGLLKRLVGASFAVYIPSLGRTKTVCQLCGEPQENLDLHEALVKRSAVGKKHQHLIFVQVNCVPLCHDCHMAHGQTRATASKCLLILAKKHSAKGIGEWYVSLIEEHGLSLPKGLQWPKKSIPVYKAVSELLPLGLLVTGLKVPEDEEAWIIYPNTQRARDFRALCVQRWKGKARRKKDRPPLAWAGVRRDDLIKTIDEGWWLQYLTTTLNLEVK